MPLRRFGWAILAVVLLAAAFHLPLLLQGKTLSSFDLCYFLSPAYHGLRPADLSRPANPQLSDPVLLLHPWDMAMFESRTIPFPWLWNPCAGCGAPLFAGSQAALGFPLKWLALLAGGRMSFAWHSLLKMVAAGLCMLLYLRELRLRRRAAVLGAFAFMGCGFLTVWRQWTVANAAVPAPLFLLAGEWLATRAAAGRPRTAAGILLLAAASAISLFGGHPETTFHLALAGGLYTLVRALGADAQAEKPARLRTLPRLLTLWTVGLLLGGALASVQILPLLESIRNSSASSLRTTAGESWWSPHWLFAAGWKYPARLLAALVLPDAWGNLRRSDLWLWPGTNYNETAGYIGAGALLLTLWGWTLARRDARVPALCALQALGLFFALRLCLVRMDPDHLPVLDLLANWRLILVFSLAAAALAAVTVDRILAGAAPPRAWLAVGAGMLAAVAVGAFHAGLGAQADAGLRAWGGRRLAFALGVLALACAAAWTASRSPKRRGAAAAALIGLAALDLGVVYGRYNTFIEPDRLYPETPALRWLQAHRAEGRVLPHSLQILPNMATAYGIEDIRLYEALLPAWYHDYLRKLGAIDPLTAVLDYDPALARIASARYLWGDGAFAPPNAAACRLVYEDPHNRIYEDPGALPRAFVAPQWAWVRSGLEALDVIRRPGFSPAQLALLEPLSGTPPAPPESSASCGGGNARIAVRKPNRVILRLSPGAAGCLVLTDTWYPGWGVRVDGKPRAVYRANGAFRGVLVNAGDREVEFAYRPRSLRTGAAVSLTALAVWCAAAFRLRRRGMPVTSPSSG